VRRILGGLGLVKKHGVTAVDAACAAALDLDVADYRFVRRYLEHHSAAPLTLRQVDPLIRELTHYRDVIAHKTQEEIPTGIFYPFDGDCYRGSKISSPDGRSRT